MNNKDRNQDAVVFFGNDRNWLALSIKTLAVFNLAGFFVLFLNNKKMTVSDFIIYSLIAILIVFANYARHVNRIAFTGDEITITRMHKKHTDKIDYFQFREKQKTTRTLLRYNELTMRNLRKKATFKVDSLTCHNYENLKTYLSRKNLLEGKNG